MIHGQYTWDADSRITARNSLWRATGNTQFQGNTVFTYDNTDQLVFEDKDWTGGTDVGMEYDADGNRTQYRTSTTKNYTVTANNRLSSDGTSTYTYDDEGNITSKQTGTLRNEYDWDHRNRLIAVRQYSNTTLQWTIDYAYDVFDRLVRRGHDTDGPSGNPPANSFYIHENGQIVLEFGQSDNGALSTRYVWGPQIDQLLVTERNSAIYGSGQVYYALADIVGTVHDTAKYNTGTGMSAVVVHRLIHDSFGRVGTVQFFDGQTYAGAPFIYTGRYYDNLTTLQWNLHRWYNGNIGRWMSEDPIGFLGDSSNAYRYVKNTPTSLTDPSGLQAFGGNEYGSWGFAQQITHYKDSKTTPKTYAVEVGLRFRPKAACQADEIAFINIARIVGINGHQFVENRANVMNRTTKDGWAIDRTPGNDSAWYGLRNDGTWGPNVTVGASGSDAIFRDRPQGSEFNTRWEFETYAICKKGKDAGKVYAGFRWGFEVDGSGNVSSLAPSHIDVASQAFLDSVSAWNAQAMGAVNNRNSQNQQVLGSIN